MLNLAQKYWDWRNKKPEGFVTTAGYGVARFADKWAVKGSERGKFCDLTGAWQWRPIDTWFKHCLATQEEIEERFGKILGLEENK